ncbi:cyclase family protein [Nonomuraea ferruginea]
MSVLRSFVDSVRNGAIEVIDLTAPLSEETPILQLPEPFGNTIRFRLEEISRYDDRGPGWYWNDIHTGEHTGTHFDAPIHWATGRDGQDVSQVPVASLIAPSRGARLHRRGGQGPRLPPPDRPRQGVGARQRPAARRRLAALPHRLGLPLR